MLPIVIMVALGAAILAGFIGWSFGRARARALAEDVQQSIEPYLRRKASEAGDEAPDHAPWTARHAPEVIVSYSAALAERLLADERRGPPGSPGSPEIALADTQQVDSGKIVTTADMKKTKKKR